MAMEPCLYLQVRLYKNLYIDLCKLSNRNFFIKKCSSVEEIVNILHMYKYYKYKYEYNDMRRLHFPQNTVSFDPKLTVNQFTVKRGVKE